MQTELPEELLTKVQEELTALDKEPVQIDGIELKPSQCYHFNVNPAHVMFNTNCPEELKEKVEAIIRKYTETLH